jgi:hypothetical protein
MSRDAPTGIGLHGWNGGFNGFKNEVMAMLKKNESDVTPLFVRN